MNEAEKFLEKLGPTLNEFVKAWGCDRRTAKRRVKQLGLKPIKIGEIVYCQPPIGKEFMENFVSGKEVSDAYENSA